MGINTSIFLTLCLETSAFYSKEFTEDEIRHIICTNRLHTLMECLWEFTGNFYKWPEALLTRHDLPRMVKEALEINLRDELVGSSGTPHTVLFANMARSIGVSLSAFPKQGPFIQQLLSNAVSLEVARAVGQFFANEATPKWHDFIAVLQFEAGVDLEFFRVHTNEDQHYHALIEGFSIEDLPIFWGGAIEFAKLRASFMDSIRNRLDKQSA